MTATTVNRHETGAETMCARDQLHQTGPPVTDSSPPPPRQRTGLAALLGAHTISSIGVAMTYVAMPWFVMEVTGSIARTGLVVTLYAVGSATVGFLAGPVVDRLGYKRVGSLAYLVGGLAMGAVVLLFHAGALTFPALLGLILLATVFDAPGAVALSGLVPGLARASGTPLVRANSAFRAISNVSQLVGPALGGVTAVIIGTHHVLLLDAATSAMASLLVALLVRPATAPHRAVAPRHRSQPIMATYLHDLLQGLGVIRRTRLLRALAGAGAAQGLLDGGLSGIVLFAAAFLWYGDTSAFGAMVSAFAAGALVGTVLYGVVGYRLPRRPVYVGAIAAAGLPLFVLGSAPPLVVTMAALALTGMVSAPIGPLVTSVLQETAPTGTYGRVTGTVRVISASAHPLGVSFAAATVTVYGTQPTIVGIAVGYVVIGVGCAWAVSFRDLDVTPARLADELVPAQK